MFEYLRLRVTLLATEGATATRTAQAVVEDLTGPRIYRALKTVLVRRHCLFGVTRCDPPGAAAVPATPPADKCRVVDLCPYGVLFASRGPGWRPPIALFVKACGTPRSQRVAVEVTLFGSAWRVYPWLVFALVDACASKGHTGLDGWQVGNVGRLHARGCQPLCGDDITGLPANLAPDLLVPALDPFLAAAPVVVELLSPMRLKEDGRLLRQQGVTTFATLLSATIQRLSDLYGAGATALLAPHVREPLEAEARRVRVLAEETRWIDVPDRSGRQGQNLMIGGRIGRVIYGPEAMQFLPILRAAEILHVGGKAAFGCGRIAVSVAQ